MATKSENPNFCSVNDRDPQQLLAPSFLENTCGHTCVYGPETEVCVFSARTLKVLHANQRVLNNSGYTLNEMRALSPFDLLIGLKDIRPKQLLKPLITKHLNVVTLEAFRQRKNGSVYPIEIQFCYSDSTTEPVFIGVATDITERKQKEKRLDTALAILRKRLKENTTELHRTKRKLKLVLDGVNEAKKKGTTFSQLQKQHPANVQQILEEDRSRIARELHDELGQGLTVLQFELAHLQKQLGAQNPQLRYKLKSMTKLLVSTSESVRTLSSRLRPADLEKTPLDSALIQLTEEFQSRTGILCKTHFKLDAPVKNPDLALAVYRVAQEGLTNIARHSGAKRLWLRLLSNQGHLTLRLSEQGVGLSKDLDLFYKSLGIRGMKERARLFGGDLVFRNQKKRGTELMLSIPLKQEE